MGVGGKVKSAFAYRFLLGWRRAVARCGGLGQGSW